MVDTLVVNLFAGPGAGKSSTAAHLYALLKQFTDLDVEYVTEYAKDRVWEQVPFPLDAMSVWGAQRHRIERVRGKVHVIVTDSPPLACLAFAALEETVVESQYPHWYSLATAYHTESNPLDIYLHRVKPYHEIGRHTDEGTAHRLDDAIHVLLTHEKLPHTHIRGDAVAAVKIMALVLGRVP